MKLIEKAWEGFERMVVPKEAGQVQRESMKMSFYAGCTVLYGVMVNMPDDEAKAMKLLSSLGEELDTHVAGLGPTQH